MFKKVIQSISKSLGGKPAVQPATKGKGGGVLDKIAKGEAVSVDSGKPKTPEELCEIQSGMSKSDIHARLKLLYRRYNRAASSLEAKTRAEAEKMLNAIVEVREKHFGQI